jgi:hypothetical protein
MIKLRRFLCGCYGGLALLFLFVSFGSVKNLLQFSSQFGIDNEMYSYTPTQKIITIIASVLGMLIIAIPLVVTFINGMAWWTVRNGKASGRGWAIAASISLILSGIPLILPMRDMWKYFPVGVMVAMLVLCGAMIVLGIAGLVAFGRRDSMAQPVFVAKPPRIAGDGTNRIFDSIAWLLGIAGYFAGMSWWYRWGRAQHLPLVHGYLSWIQIVVAILITVALHESGHTATGLVLGMRLRAFIVGPFHWRIRDGRWKFQFLPAKFLSAGGATALVPTNLEQSRWKEICMIAAGPLASLFTGLIAMAAAVTTIGRSYEQYWELFALIATISLVGFAVNLIPFRPEALYSDGAQIYQLLQGGPWADLHRAFNIAASTTVTPLRPRDYDIEAIKRAEQSFAQGHQALMLRLIASSYYLDRGMIPEACDAVTEAERIQQESALDLPAELCMAFVYRTAILCRDAASARKWWELMEAKKPTHFGVDYWLAQSALFWIEGRKEEARAAWNKGDLLAQQLPAAGDYEFDRYRSALLHDCIENAGSSAA